MVSKEQLDDLESYRAVGIKSIEFGQGGFHVQRVEFFPMSVFDHAGNLLSGEGDDPLDERRERDTEAPPAAKVPPAMVRVLQKGSVS